MRAYENVSLYCQLPEAVQRSRMKEHHKRIKNAQPVLKVSPRGEGKKVSPRALSPNKCVEERQGNIAKNNMILARRIFDIMEGPGIISNLMENSVTENHPGTINFSHRLQEAKRIHRENLVMASRLDTVKAYYDGSNLRTLTTAKKSRKKKPKFGCESTTKKKKNNNPATAGGRVVLGKNALDISQDFNAGSQSEDSKRPRNVLLEYTKIQKGRVLDVAVIKEPFRDSYSIFGIDIDNGQRYELRLSSEEVSSILEGDILVTSVDNVEVWMALLNKVELQPVEAFAKLPLPASSRSEQAVPISKPAPDYMSPNNRQDSLQAENESNCAVGEEDGDSITEADSIQQLKGDRGDSMSQDGYTLDDYYEANVPLSPLPPQDLGGARSAPMGSGGERSPIEEQEGHYGELLDATFFDRMSANGGGEGRPSARSGTARTVSRQHSGRPVSDGDNRKTDSTGGVGSLSDSDFNPPPPSVQETQKAVHIAAVISTTYYLETASRNVAMKLQSGTTSNKKKTAAVKDKGSRKMSHNPQVHVTPASKRDAAKEAAAAREASATKPVQKSPKPPNPYTSTKISAAPRSKSIRYTQVPKAITAAQQSHEAHNSKPEEVPRDATGRKAPVEGGGRKSVLKTNPKPPQGSQPSNSRKPTHRQTKASKQVREEVVKDTQSLAQSVVQDYIKDAQAKVEGLILLTTMDVAEK